MANGVEIRNPKPKGRPQVRRERADLLITRMIEEAQAINADSRMMHAVVKLSVFGSYLGHKPVLGDLDVAFQLYARWEPDDYDARDRQFREHFSKPASIASDFLHRLVWSEIITIRRLRVGRGISFHNHSEIDSCGLEHRTFFATRC